MLTLLLACAPEGGPGTLITTDEGWYLPFGTAGSDDGAAVLAISGGDAIVLTEQAGQGDAPDAKLYRVDSEGTLIWGQSIANPGADRVRGAILDDSTLYVAGSRLGEDDAQEAVVLAFQAEDGLPLWSWRFSGGFGGDEAVAVAADGGSAWVAGHGVQDPAGEQGRDIWLAELDADGATVWQVSHGGARQEEATDLARAGEALYLTGRIDGGGEAAVEGASDPATGGDAWIGAFAAKDGALSWERRLSDDIARWESAGCVAVETADGTPDGAASAIYAGGAAAGDTQDLRAWALTPAGELSWTLEAGGDGADQVDDLALSGDSLVLGVTTAPEGGAGGLGWGLWALPTSGPDLEAELSVDGMGYGLEAWVAVDGAGDDALRGFALSGSGAAQTGDGQIAWMIGQSGSSGAGGADALLVHAPARGAEVVPE